MTPARRLFDLLFAVGALVGTYVLLAWADVPTGTAAKIIGATVAARLAVAAITVAISNGEDDKK